MGIVPVDPAPMVWVVGAWPRPKSMRRVLRTDGVLPTEITDAGGRPADLRATVASANVDRLPNGQEPVGDDSERPALTGSADLAQRSRSVRGMGRPRW